MRAWYPILVAATIGCVVWCALIWSIFPIGPVDSLYVNFRPELARIADPDETGRLMALLSRLTTNGVRTTVLFTAAPLLLTNLGWGYLAYRLLRERGDIT